MLMKGRIIILNNKEPIYKKQEKLYIYEYYHESMKMMDQHGEKAEFVDKRVSLFKVHFTMVDGLRMVENMSGIRQMRFI